MLKIFLSYFFPAIQGVLSRGGGETASGIRTVISANDGDMIESVDSADTRQLPEEEEIHDPEENKRAKLIRETGMQAATGLAEVRESLQMLCQSTDLQFIQIGRDLQKVSAESKELTQSMLDAAKFVGDESNETGILERTKSLIMSILGGLAAGRRSLENSVANVRELINRMYEFHSINAQIATISSHFKVVRFNIRIQCSSILVSESMFKSVTEDIDSLSRKLHAITAQVKHELTASGKKLADLEQSVSGNLVLLQANVTEAEKSVQHILQDIKQLMHGAAVMIDEARSRSERISHQVEDVVVSIQFHDSMSQRVDHIIRALDDVCSLSNDANENVSPQHLGSAWLILDLQHRQLVQIIDEIGAVKKSISESFRIIEEEISGLDAIQNREQFEAIGPQQFLCSRFNSLKDALVRLSQLLSESGSMLEKMRSSARETEEVTIRLREMMQEIQEVREDTRLQAVNTIIMASNLGQKGRTIQVLAKEINNLSDQTGVVAGDAKKMQSAINAKVDELLQHSNEVNDTADPGEVNSIEQNISESCSNVEHKVDEVSKGIRNAGKNIDSIRSGLVFLDDLQERLSTITGKVDSIKERLSSWRNDASINSAEVEKLVERYTMDRERAVHSFEQFGGAREEQDDEDIFF